MNIFKKLIEKLKYRKINKKIEQLEKEIEEVRSLTTENYWKLKKEISRGQKRTTKTRRSPIKGK